MKTTSIHAIFSLTLLLSTANALADAPNATFANQSPKAHNTSAAYAPYETQ